MFQHPMIERRRQAINRRLAEIEDQLDNDRNYEELGRIVDRLEEEQERLERELDILAIAMEDHDPAAHGYDGW